MPTHILCHAQHTAPDAGIAPLMPNSSICAWLSHGLALAWLCTGLGLVCSGLVWLCVGSLALLRLSGLALVWIGLALIWSHNLDSYELGSGLVWLWLGRFSCDSSLDCYWPLALSVTGSALVWR